MEISLAQLTKAIRYEPLFMVSDFLYTYKLADADVLVLFENEHPEVQLKNIRSSQTKYFAVSSAGFEWKFI